MELGVFGKLPRGAWSILREATRHVLRHPVVGVLAIAWTEDDRLLLIRRADTGTWAMPGGTLEWGETLRDGLARELEEEAGVVKAEFVRVVGVYSRPDRDPRFHAVTIAVEVRVAPPVKSPSNPLEIREARLFTLDSVPRPLAFGLDDILDVALKKNPATFE